MTRTTNFRPVNGRLFTLATMTIDSLFRSLATGEMMDGGEPFDFFGGYWVSGDTFIAHVRSREDGFERRDYPIRVR